jgi:hypothetical protein
VLDVMPMTVLFQSVEIIFRLTKAKEKNKYVKRAPLKSCRHSGGPLVHTCCCPDKELTADCSP